MAWETKIAYNKDMKEVAKGIAVDPKIRFGKPVITGTRVPVDLIIRELGNGMAIEEVAEEYKLTNEQIRNALRYAAERLEEEELTLA